MTVTYIKSLVPVSLSEVVRVQTSSCLRLYELNIIWKIGRLTRYDCIVTGTTYSGSNGLIFELENINNRKIVL